MDLPQPFINNDNHYHLNSTGNVIHFYLHGQWVFIDLLRKTYSYTGPFALKAKRSPLLINGGKTDT